MKKLLLFGSVLVLSGCFHASIETGAAPSAMVIEKPWAPAFVYGLVPPPTVQTQAQCGAKGVSKVETRISFLNGLVSGLTFSLFTPMHIKVTCAA